MKTKQLPARPITSAEDLMRMFYADETLPNTMEEVRRIMAVPPDDWFGKTILFPRVIIPPKTEGQGDVVVSAQIISFSWNEEKKEWEEEHHLAGREGWGRLGPDHVDSTAIIPQRA